MLWEVGECLMFLITITKDRVAHDLQFPDVQEVYVKSFVVTAVADKFLSKLVSELNGFSIVESPLISYPNFGDIVFSKVNYNKSRNILNIFKSTISGRSIYYHMNSKNEFFCSTHISMLRKAGVTIEENTEDLPEFFVYRYVMPPRSLYKNINQLSMGGQLRLRILDDKCIIQSIEHYNVLEQKKSISSIKKSATGEYNYLSKSIKKLNPCKDEVAVLLSGGIDTSILSRICQNVFGIASSYSTGYPFEDPKLNHEKSYALSAAEAFGLKHHYYEPTTQDYLFGFIEGISLAEQPIGHLQSVLLHLLFKNGISQNKKIVVHGQGGSVLFGHVIDYLYMMDKISTKLLSKKVLKEILVTAARFSQRGKLFVDILNKYPFRYQLSNPNNEIWSWKNYGNLKWVCNYFNVTNEDIIKRRYSLIKQFESRSIYDLWASYSLLGNEDNTLATWSKIGEGNKKILYAPLYDFDLLNYVSKMPWKLKLKMRNILQKETARQSNIPEFIITRPSMSFGLLAKNWSEKGGIFEPLVPLASKVFDQKQIRDMQCRDQQKAWTFWNILNYSLWKRLCIRNEPLDRLYEELEKSISEHGGLRA